MCSSLNRWRHICTARTWLSCLRQDIVWILLYIIAREPEAERHINVWLCLLVPCACNM